MASALALQSVSKPRLLVVEDEPFILLTLEDMLSDLGCEVAASATRISEALSFIETGKIDGALLDVNLGNQKIDPVADRLAALDCPFIFTTGYGRSGVPPTHMHRGVLQKPFRMDELAHILRTEFKFDQVPTDW